MIEIAENIYFVDGKIKHNITDKTDEALLDSLSLMEDRSSMTIEDAKFIIECILNGEYIPQLCGVGLGLWTGEGYYRNERYKKWYMWQTNGPLGHGFYEATLQSYFPEVSTISSKFNTHLTISSV